MRAIRREALGGPEVLQLVEVDRPRPGPIEVLVKVHAAGVNPVDWKCRVAGGYLETRRSPWAGACPAWSRARRWA